MMIQVSIIIPHAGGREILTECLAAVEKSVGVTLETIVVDNGSDDAAEVCRPFSAVQIVRFPCRLGFSAACNRGVEAAKGEYVFLLNNDAVVEPDSIARLYEAMNHDPAIGAVQPKLLSYADPTKFDYSSAAGGEMDIYGYPFARGRVFGTLETDAGQYDDIEPDIFFGAGAALMIRRDLYRIAGGLEERFFAHFEEIDLQWRLQLMGYRIRAITASVVRHRGAVTIASGSFRKLYLNHRNSLATLFRNYGAKSLLRIFPLRLLIDFYTMAGEIFRGDFVHGWAIIRADCWFLFSLPYLIKSRGIVQRLRVVPDQVILNRLYPGSIVWNYFFRKRRTWRQLH